MRCCDAWKSIDIIIDPIFGMSWLSETSSNCCEPRSCKSCRMSKQDHECPWDIEKDNAPARCWSWQCAWRHKNLFYLSVLWLMRKTIHWSTCRKSETSPNEDILRYVQKAPDDIHRTIKRTDFNEVIAMQKDSALAPDGIPYADYWCTRVLGSQFLCNANKYLLHGNVLFQNISLKAGLSLSPRPLISMTTEELLDLPMRFVHWQYQNVINLPYVEAWIGTLWDSYTLRFYVSFIGKWRTTFLRYYSSGSYCMVPQESGILLIDCACACDSVNHSWILSVIDKTASLQFYYSILAKYL